MHFSSSEDELLMSQQPKRKKAKYSIEPDYEPSRDKTDHSKRRGRQPTLEDTRSVLEPPRVETILSSSEGSINSFRARKKASKCPSVAAKDPSSSSRKPALKRPFAIGALTMEKTELPRKKKADSKASSFRSNTRGDDLTDSSSDDETGASAVKKKKKKLGKSARTPIGRQPQKPASTTRSAASSRPPHPDIHYALDSSEDESKNVRKKSKGKSDIPWSTDCDIDSPPPSTLSKDRGCYSLKRRSSTKSDKSIFEFSSQDENVGSKPPGRGTTSGIPTPLGSRGKEKKTKQIRIYPKARS
jgi:hypothetical protein